MILSRPFLVIVIFYQFLKRIVDFAGFFIQREMSSYITKNIYSVRESASICVTRVKKERFYLHFMRIIKQTQKVHCLYVNNKSFAELQLSRVPSPDSGKLGSTSCSELWRFNCLYIYILRKMWQMMDGASL